VLLFFAINAAAPDALGADAWVVRLRGDVRLLRGKSVRKLEGETRLKAGDVVLSGRDARFTYTLKGVRLEAAPETAVEHASPPRLHYGHVRAVNPGADVRLGLPTASLRAPRGAELLAHVARDRAEFDRRLSGLAEPAPPAAAIRLGARSPDLHVQVTCLAGSVELRPGRSERLSLRPGDLARVHSSVGDFAPVRAGLDEVRRVRQVLGFQDN
jgi:hypothetical protein